MNCAILADADVLSKKTMKMIECCLCGADLTGPLTFYDNKARRYCYDCFQKISRKPTIHRKPLTEEQKLYREIKMMYRRGNAPSQIAKKLHISAKRVYEVLNER